MKKWFLSIFLVLLFFSPTQAQVVGLHKLFDYQHYDIDRSVAPTNGQGLVWNSTTRKWAPGSGSGANSSGYYVVTRATSAPTNAVNLGALSSGLLYCTVADGVCTFSIKAIGTDVQAYNATLAAIAALTESQGAILYFTADNTPAILAKGTAGQLLQMNSGATAPEWTSSLTGTFTFGNGATSAGFFYLAEDSTNGTSKAQIIGAASLAGDIVITMPDTTDTLVGKATTDELTNKTLDVDGTGNVVKSWGYLVLTHPHLCAAGAAMQTTSTANTYGQCLYGNGTDKATNYAEYYLVVPPDIDTSVDLTATFKIQLSNADTGDHEYEISFDSVANSAAYAGSLADAISLAYTADASGAQYDVETAGETTLTGWRAAMTAGQLMVIRVARDGDHANDGSTVDSYSGPLVIKYKITQ